MITSHDVFVRIIGKRIVLEIEEDEESLCMTPEEAMRLSVKIAHKAALLLDNKKAPQENLQGYKTVSY